ncbi:glycosyltransferase family 2 protein [bacterium]|nr:glycosyltransferase family 2 protein [bacterium]
MPRLSVVIPAYNEESRLPATLARLREYFASDGDVEVIVVDDGSADDTRKIAGDIAKDWPALRVVANDRNRGKGYTVRHGVQEAAGDVVLFYDADSSTPIEEYEKLRPHLEAGADVAIGSRSLPGSDVRVHQPWYRETMGRMFNLFVRLVAVRGIVDTQCGFKAFRLPAARAVFARQKLSGFSFDVELLFIARRLGYSIKEVPIVWINSPASRVHPVWDSLRMFLELLKIRANAWRGAYDDAGAA